jgi:hypothetical protein
MRRAAPRIGSRSSRLQHERWSTRRDPPPG